MSSGLSSDAEFSRVASMALRSSLPCSSMTRSKSKTRARAMSRPALTAAAAKSSSERTVSLSEPVTASKGRWKRARSAACSAAQMATAELRAADGRRGERGKHRGVSARARPRPR
jgi:hypothetical protein